MDFFEAVNRRACYRGEFNDVPVPREILTKVLNAGIMAPSACNQQTPSFIVIDEPEVLKEIANIMNTPTCNTAKAMIVCISDRRPVFDGNSFYREDCAAAVQSMLLALVTFGYYSVWLDGILRREGIAEKIAKILHVPSNKHVQILLPIGVPSRTVTRTSRLSFEKRVSFNYWGKQQ